MAEALRNLQIFRNGALMTGTAYEVKAAIAGLISNSQLELHDGEPISVRYQEELNGEVKGLYGVAYGSGTTAKVLWGGSGENVSIVTEPQPGYNDYVTLRHTYDGTENEYTLIVDSNVVNLDTAEVGTTGLADALDVKEHIRYYNVEAGDDIVVVSPTIGTDANGFNTTTFTVSISTENLPEIPKYTIGTITTSQDAFKTYALFKDGDEVTGSIIDIPMPTEYTAGDAITISTTNVVSVKLSSDNGNQIGISLNDGGLFVPAGETIVDVSSITAPGDYTQNVYYGYLNNDYVVIEPDGQGGWTYNGQPYSGPVGGPVRGGSRYLVVQTSGGNMYFANNDSSADIHVSGFGIGTDSSDNDVLRITMNNNDTYDVLISDIAPEIPAATVTWDTANDELNIGTEGILTQLALGTIEAYIDNFDCGTF